jgi:hypothetical protein
MLSLCSFTYSEMLIYVQIKCRCNSLEFAVETALLWTRKWCSFSTTMLGYIPCLCLLCNRFSLAVWLCFTWRKPNCWSAYRERHANNFDWHGTELCCSIGGTPASCPRFPGFTSRPGYRVSSFILWFSPVTWSKYGYQGQFNTYLGQMQK